jgi:hypothetical protein
VEIYTDCTEPGKPIWHEDRLLVRTMDGYTGYVEATGVATWTPGQKLKRWRFLQTRARNKLREAIAAEPGFEHLPEAGLVLYDRMRASIEQCANVDEVMDVRNKALALALYKKQAGDREAETKLAGIRIRAERRIGELLREMRESGERDTGKGGDRKSRSVETTVKPKTLSDLGVSKDQSRKFQQLADIPTEQFEEAVSGSDAVPTTGGVLGHAKRQRSHSAGANHNASACRGMPPLFEWVYRQVLAFDNTGTLSSNATDIYAQMSRDQRRDVARVARLLIPWLQTMIGECRKVHKATRADKISESDRQQMPLPGMELEQDRTPLAPKTETADQKTAQTRRRA